MTGASDGSAGDRRRARDRELAARSAAAGPSAARWLLAEDDGEVVALDVVRELLALDPRTRLRGRGDAQLRRLAGRCDALVGVGATAPSGRPLLEVLVADEATREALAPSLDLDALLAGTSTPSASHDRAVRVAEALLARADAHRAGEVDLYAEVAPVGTHRHPRADEVETLVHVATDRLVAVGGPDPAVVTATDGWIAVSPVELFLAAAAGLLEGTARDVGGAVLVGWLQQVQRDPGDGWWLGLSSRLPVDVDALLRDAAARAGSDHPDVAGAALVDRIRGSHPIDG